MYVDTGIIGSLVLCLVCETGKAPLHLTSFEGNVKMTKALLKCGADINIPDDCGKMPLHWAVSRNKSDVIRALADGGANVDAKTKKGR